MRSVGGEVLGNGLFDYESEGKVDCSCLRA
jgi:hypothetical protein